MASFEANVADRFPTGAKLDVIPRLGDSFSRGGSVKSVTVGKTGDVKVDTDPGPYWLSDGETHVAFTVKDLLDGDSRVLRDAEAIRQRIARDALAQRNPGLTSAAPGYTTTPNVVTGARGSADAKRKVQDPSPQPFLNQLDVEKVPQRSDTPQGEAHPIPEEEIRMEKDPEKEVEKLQGEPMRSDTEFGANPVIPRAELKRDQQAAKGKLEEGVDPKAKSDKLASDTPLGTKPPADVSAEVPAEDSPPIKSPKQVPAEGVRAQKKK